MAKGISAAGMLALLLTILVFLMALSYRPSLSLWLPRALGMLYGTTGRLCSPAVFALWRGSCRYPLSHRRGMAPIGLMSRAASHLL
jgi:hypothetical protein